MSTQLNLLTMRLKQRPLQVLVLVICLTTLIFTYMIFKTSKPAGPAPIENIHMEYNPHGETPTRTITTNHGHMPTPQQKKKRVALSLLIKEEWRWLHRMLNSLLTSDIVQHEIEFFVWSNSIDAMAADYLSHMRDTYRIHLRGSKEESGIVMPRIWNMAAVRNSTVPFDYLIEIHDDMVFPRKWFNDLIAQDHGDMKYAIFQPFIVNGHSAVDMTHTKLDAIIKDNNLVKNNKLENCIQVHPWVINLPVIDKLGYYDPQYSPSEVEDDDFLARVISAGYKTVSVQTSWVAHAGMATQRSTATLGRNFGIFKQKFGITVDEFKMFNLTHCHPTFQPTTGRYGF